MTIAEQVSSFLRANNGKAFCDDCLQKLVKLKLRQQAQRVTGALEQTREFTREEGTCSNCGKEKKVIRSNSK
jgi:hypothetical protein